MEGTDLNMLIARLASAIKEKKEKEDEVEQEVDIAVEENQKQIEEDQKKRECEERRQKLDIESNCVHCLCGNIAEKSLSTKLEKRGEAYYTCAKYQCRFHLWKVL